VRAFTRREDVSGGVAFPSLLTLSFVEGQRKGRDMTNVDAIFAAMFPASHPEDTGPAGVGLELIEDLELGLRHDKNIVSLRRTRPAKP
jgi:hypothetical protein